MTHSRSVDVRAGSRPIARGRSGSRLPGKRHRVARPPGPCGQTPPAILASIRPSTSTTITRADLNPVEGIWSLVRRGPLANRIFVDPEHLERVLRQGLREIQYRPHLIDGVLAETRLTIGA